MRWSVAVEAEGDRVLTREEIVELADAVAAHSGIASGIGTTRYGAQLVVEADSREDAVRARAPRSSTAAAAQAGLPAWPIAGRRRDQRGRRRDAVSSSDPARLARRLPVRGPARARRLDAAGDARRVRDHVQAGAGDQARDVRRDLRRSLRDLSTERFPFNHPRGGVLDPAGRQPLEGLHLHLRGARAGCRRTASRSPRSSARSTTRPATSSSTTRRGRTSGSASTPRRPPVR